MPAAAPSHGVGILKRCIAASLREPIDATKPRIAASGGAHLDLRHDGGWTAHPVVGGIPCEGLLKINPHAIQSGMKLIRDRGGEDVNVPQRNQIPLGGTP